MDALDVMKVCLRRWYVMLPVVLLAVGAALGLALNQKPVYTAFGSYALVYTHGEDIKPNQVDPRSDNPLSNENATLLAEALAADYMSKPMQKSLGGSGTSGVAPGDAADGSAYSVTLPEGAQSYRVQSWGPDPSAVREVVDSVLTSAPTTAQQIQDRAGAPRESQYTTFTTSPVQVGKLPGSSKVKLISAVGALGVLAGAAMSVIADRLLYRRRRRQADREPPAGPSAGAAPGTTGGTANGEQEVSEETQRSPHDQEEPEHVPEPPDSRGAAAQSGKRQSLR